MFKNLLGGCAVVVVVVLLILAPALYWGAGVGLADIIGRGEAHKTTHSGNYRIDAYNSFFNQCASIQALEGKIDAQNGLLAASPAPDGTTWERIQTNIAGLQATRAEAITKYNADTRKTYTIGQWKDDSLPYQIDSSIYTGINGTHC